jgi:hypothetical protein
MFLEGIIEIIISMIFIWFVLSAATAQIQEWIAARLHWRATDLENAITGMLNDRALTRLFYDHPIIRSLSGKDGGQDSKPSYIPSQQFATVLLSIILGAGSESALLIHGLYGLEEQLVRIQSKEERRQARLELERIFELARLSAAAERGTAMDNLILVTLEKDIGAFAGRHPEVRDLVIALQQKAGSDLEQIQKVSSALPDADEKSRDVKSMLKGTLALGVINPGLRLALNSLLIGIDKDEISNGDFLNLLQANLETWFNHTMDRLSGWYKRKVQVVTFLIGLAAALLLNIDSIQISTQLWREPALREAISANSEYILQQYGQEAGAQGIDLIDALQMAQDQYLGLPVGWNINAVQLNLQETCSFSPGPGQVFGFNWNQQCMRPFGAESSTNGWLWSLSKLAGLLMTGLASAQGSSFWFDIFKKVVNVRSAGIKPA